MTTTRRQAAISVSGLRSQNALLIFGEALEARLAPAEVRLVRAKGSSGVFAADDLGVAELSRALADIPGFDVLSSVRPSARDASLTLVQVVAHEAATRPWSVSEPFAPAPAVAAPHQRVDARRPTTTPAREIVALSAHPLGSFREVGQFRDTLLTAPGVLNVTVNRFYRGSLSLRVEYEDLVPLAARLQDIEAFRTARIVQEDDESIDLAIGGYLPNIE